MRKEDFFEVLGGLDGNYVIEASRKRKIKRRAWAAMAACIAAAALVGMGLLQMDGHEEPIRTMKPVINFEGVVTAVEGDSILLNNGKTILITEDTRFMGDPDTGNPVSEEILVGNFIQGYTPDDADAAEITAGRIWTNEARAGSSEKRVVNFEGQVAEAGVSTAILADGRIVRITGDTSIAAPDGS